MDRYSRPFARYSIYLSNEDSLPILFLQVNHSFEPSAKFCFFKNPRFGETRCLQTLRDIKKGEEIFVDYLYNTDSVSGINQNVLTTGLSFVKTRVTLCYAWYIIKLIVNLFTFHGNYYADVKI